MVDRYQFGPFNSEDGTMSLMHPSLSPTEKLVRYSDYQKLEAALTTIAEGKYRGVLSDFCRAAMDSELETKGEQGG